MSRRPTFLAPVLVGCMAFVCACHGAPAANPGPTPATATPFVGSLTATFTRLVNYPATPDPIAATDVSGRAGPVTLIHALDHGRTLDIRIADKAPLKIGSVYNVNSQASLDTTGVQVGASLAFTNELGNAWTSDTGTLSIALVAGNEVGCYFQGVELLPAAGVMGSFYIDGQAVATLVSPGTR
jgi:hypothetical protein